jgi:hypothetical protein
MSRGISTVIDAYFDGVNEERYEDVADLFADDGELVAPGTEPRRREAIAEYFAAALKPYPGHDDRPGRVLIAGSTALVEIHFTGRMDSGFEIEFDAVDIDQQDRITRLSSWYDSHLVRSRLREARGRV